MELLTKARNTDEVNDREKRNLNVAYKAACESMVLLKNEGVLPLRTKRVALYGAGASKTVKGGTGSGEVNERRSVTILEGMENRGFEITSRTWLSDYDEGYEKAAKDFLAMQKRALLKLKIKSVMDMMFASFQPPAGRVVTDKDVLETATDTCIYVIGRQAGEGADRRSRKGDLLLTDEERVSIEKCAKCYKNFVLVINSGSALDMAFLDEIEGIDAVLYICQLGTEGGNAFADVISGKVSPSGKLADTWAKKYSDIPFSNEFSYLNGNLEDEYYKEGIYVGYRYFDSFEVEPCFPFGFGLSYTNFTIFPLGVKKDGTKITVKAEVINSGGRFCGKEVVQVYLCAPDGRLDKEYQSLVAFAKTKELAPAKTDTLELTFDMAEAGSYDESRASYILEKGDYIVRLGNSSRSTAPVAVITLEDEVVISKHENICPVRQKFEELKSEDRGKVWLNPGITRITMDASEFSTIEYTYEIPSICKDEHVTKFMQGLSVSEMVDIVVGIGMFGGETRFTLPGAVGRTTSKFWDRGLVNIALCDGPAGLRIQKRSTVEKNGKTKAVDMAMSLYQLIPKFVKKFMLGDPKKSPVIYQYTTAFPVEAALAQTWNTAILEEVGKAIYEEMKEYGCTYWLAPAMNIHRNPLCGRNFEYFSEDPYLTGEMAAAITKGIQQEEGFYVTIKHFACNNQEDNRTGVSSNVSERALREIYLRGFERAVRKANAKGVMTSYNRLNGIYTPNSYDLCTKVLRNEWGFDGVVMTDWFSTNKGQGNNAVCMKVGNDLIMPGGSYYKKEILNGLENGEITEDDIRRCCANVIKAIMDSAIQREYM